MKRHRPFGFLRRSEAGHARHHYDVPIELYRLFLDDQLQYSCAYFRDPERDTLEQAQQNKLIHATSKLQLKPGMTVAEIGSGWGGFAIHLARETGAHVTGLVAVLSGRRGLEQSHGRLNCDRSWVYGYRLGVRYQNRLDDWWRS